MIRLAVETDFPEIATNEVLVRICGLRLAYGPNASFIHYYSDGEGALLALMDRVGLFHAISLTEEWCAFLAMNPDIATIHCSEAVGEALIRSGLWQGRVGPVMKYAGPLPAAVDAAVCTTPSLPKVYDLLRENFPDIAPFDSWYPDVSHRVRHGNTHISVILEGELVVSTAMTVAETNTAAVIGQVATHPDFRRRGLAGTCVKSTIFQCKDKQLYILPVNVYAQKLYESLGFIIDGGWAELERT